MQKLDIVYAVDDDPTAGVILGKLLRDVPMFEFFTSAQELLSACFHKMPDMIISDVYMPDMTGIELQEQVRALQENTVIPFIFVTGDEGFKDKSTHATRYIIKPLKPENLMHALQQLDFKSEVS